MSSYNALAPWYDKLTADVPYSQFADFYESRFERTEGEFSLLLDLCCGTGTLTWELASRGYEMIAADRSVEMLMQAQGKGREVSVPPLFLCQSAEELDLYGTVDATICSLDAMNYIPPEKLPELFHRLKLFIRPDGLLIFDIKSPEAMRSLDGEVFVDEKDDILCLWRADYDDSLSAIIYGMDIFSRKRGNTWIRDSEEHIEYLHTEQRLVFELEKAGFVNVSIEHDCPQGDKGRVFVIATRGQ